MCPAIADRLIEELDLEPQRSALSDLDREAHAVVPADEVRIALGLTVHRGIRQRRCLGEAARQQAVVLEIPRGLQEACRDVPLLVAEDRLVDLDLIRGAQIGVMRLEVRGIEIVVVALDRTVREQLARLEPDAPCPVPYGP